MRSADAGVSSVGAYEGLGGSVGEAIAAELEERAALAHSEQLVLDNERMRKEVEMLMAMREDELLKESAEAAGGVEAARHDSGNDSTTFEMTEAGAPGAPPRITSTSMALAAPSLSIG